MSLDAQRCTVPMCIHNYNYTSMPAQGDALERFVDVQASALEARLCAMSCLRQPFCPDKLVTNA